jgi:hypothetical protein
MTIFYESTTTHWSSEPKSGKTYGTRNVVKIKNGKGTKTKESLNKSGKVIQQKTKRLKQKEIKLITKNQFIPNFWSNCKLGACTRKNKK